MKWPASSDANWGSAFIALWMWKQHTRKRTVTDSPTPTAGHSRRILAAIGAGLLVMACNLGQAANPETSNLPVLQPTQAGVEASQMAMPVPTPLPTASVAPEPTPAPTHPLMIEVMRQQTYPGSEIILEEWLEPGATYDRYIVSYLSEGNKIYALLTLPRGQMPPTGWPVIIFNHGYIPPEQYRTTERYVAYVDAFANHGYIVLRSDYRGHGDSEGAATGAYGSPAYTIDVLNAVSSIKTFPHADSSRIGMWGHSMGGQITLRTMVVTDDIKAGVIWAGVVGPYPDLFARGQQTGPAPPQAPNPRSTRGRWRSDLAETFGSPEENPAFWASLSPNAYLTDLSGPIQLHHSTTDESVPVEASQLLLAQMQAAGMPVELYLYEGDDHNISHNFATAMQRSIQFFDAYVKG